LNELRKNRDKIVPHLGFDRNSRMTKAVLEGKSLEVVAQDYDLSRERVRQICYKMARSIYLDRI